MWRVMKQKQSGISYGDLLAELVKHPDLGKNRSKGDKGFYQAIRRLIAAGDLVKVGGTLYTASLAKLLRDQGHPIPETPSNGRSGGARSIILSVLIEHPKGLTGPQLKQIIAAKHPDAPSSLRSDSHYIYNVLGGMKKAGEVAKEGDFYKTTAMAEARSVH